VGADINLKDKNSRTALHCAVDFGNHVVAQTLLGAGADINAKNGAGRTALELAKHDAMFETLKADQRGHNV
jgi:ankyrin repeat protein